MEEPIMQEHHDSMTEIQIEEYKSILEQRGLENSFQVLKAFLVKGSSILDVGCGPGTVTIDVARYVDSGSVVGVDLMPEMVERSKEYAASKLVENVTFQAGNSYELDFADSR